MREPAARMIETPTAIVTLAVAVGLGMGFGVQIALEAKQLVFPYKPTHEVCKSMGYTDTLKPE